MTRAGASERQRRLRARQRAGLVVAPVPVTPEVVTTLLELRRIGEADSRRRDRLGEAIAEVLAELAADHHRRKIP